jgi:4-aminobutyrate aminotransferase-like enzyme
VTAPDIVALASVLGDSLTSQQAVSILERRFHNQLGAHVALHCLRSLEDAGTYDSAIRVGAKLRSGLEALAKEHPGLIDVRGEGLMLAIELDPSRLNDPVENPWVYTMIAHLFWAECARSGLAFSGCTYALGSLKLTPPMTLTEVQVDEALSILSVVLERGVRRWIQNSIEFWQTAGDKRTEAFFARLLPTSPTEQSMETV